MKLDGKQISSEILSGLKKRVDKLREAGVIPTLLVVLVGDNEQSIIYIKQKEKKAAEIGARTEVLTFDESISFEKARTLIEKLNKDPLVHGIIVQRPAPQNLRVDELSELIDPEKEIDGFGKNPRYRVPVAEATIALIRSAFEQMKLNGRFEIWLKKQKIVLIGKGETAGKPIANHLASLGVKPLIIDRETKDPDSITKSADILISSVGKANFVTPGKIKKGVILIGVGLTQNADGKLVGDYDEEKIKDIASFYTPTPGGIGPVNVACLMSNLVKAAQA